MAVYTIKDTTLTSIADAIREKTGKTDLITPEDMGAAITNLPSGGGDLPEEAFNITDNCIYRFAYNGWNWFIKEYGNKISVNTSVFERMFYYSTNLESIDFDITYNGIQLAKTQYIFGDCRKLTRVPYIKQYRYGPRSYFFSNCWNLRQIPDDYCDTWITGIIDNETESGYATACNHMFENCYSLRSFPMEFLEHDYKRQSYNYNYFNYGFTQCNALDELVDLPIPYTSTWTSNAFNNTFNNCYRLKNLTFKMPNGQPYTMNWKNQIIDLTYNVGYALGESLLLNYNSGITADKHVYNDATYQALKNDPDWFATFVTYSRYNHDSAVATINSLPNTSAYLATSGGTNTIKFTGGSGRGTDGGAIDTLTESEIAVATAKGWTVTLS